jgi:hypothetical protein
VVESDNRLCPVLGANPALAETPWAMTEYSAILSIGMRGLASAVAWFRTVDELSIPPFALVLIAQVEGTGSVELTADDPSD